MEMCALSVLAAVVSAAVDSPAAAVVVSPLAAVVGAAVVASSFLPHAASMVAAIAITRNNAANLLNFFISTFPPLEN